MDSEPHNILKSHLGKIVGTVAGFVLGLLVIGFVKVIIVAIFCVAGYFIGRYIDELKTR